MGERSITLTDQTNADQPTKQRVLEALRSRADDGLAAARSAVEAQRAAAESDSAETASVDNLSQSDQAGEMTSLYEGSEARQLASREALDALDFGPHSTVAPGALVSFDGGHYVVGVVSDAVVVDGVSYEGISADAPLYPAIEGLRAGDSFTFGGREHRIDAVE